MKKRNEGFISLSAVILLAALGFLVFSALTDGRPGLNIGSAPLEKRVSFRYLTKSVNSPDQAEIPAAGVEFGTSGYENGSANIVTSIVVDYRVLDTLGEILVLFAAAGGVALLMQERNKKIEQEASVIVKTAVPVIMLFALVVGAYIVINGHLSPGGGFSGGAVIASAFILQFLAFRKNPRSTGFKITETLAGLAILAYGLIGLFTQGSLFANFLPTGTVGEFLSASGIVILYTLIGVKVAAELSAVSGNFIGGEE